MHVIQGGIVIVDAIRSLRGIANVIGEKGEDDVPALKGDHGSLPADVELFANGQKANGFARTKISQAPAVDSDHVGRTSFWLELSKDKNYPVLLCPVSVQHSRRVATTSGTSNTDKPIRRQGRRADRELSLIHI